MRANKTSTAHFFPFSFFSTSAGEFGLGFPRIESKVSSGLYTLTGPVASDGGAATSSSPKATELLLLVRRCPGSDKAGDAGRKFGDK